MKRKSKLNKQSEIYKAIIAKFGDEINAHRLKYLTNIYLKEAKKFFKNHSKDEANLNKFFKITEKRIIAEREQSVAKVKKLTRLLKTVDLSR